MIECYICNTKVIIDNRTTNTRNIGIKIASDKYICLACQDIITLFDNNKPKKQIKEITIKEEKIHGISQKA